MPIRTTDEAVAGIKEVDPDIPLDPFIEVAAAIVDEICVPLGYTDAHLELIERWLAAHFYSVRDPNRTSETAGSVAESFASRVDLGLNLTWHGQQAMIIDFKGGLRALQNSKGGRATAFWLGVDRRLRAYQEN